MEYISEFQSTFEEVDIQVQKICFILNTQPVRPTNNFMFTIDYVLRELLNNAVEHGNKMNQELKVTYKIVLEAKKITIEVLDQGTGFSLESSIKISKSVDPLRERNRGLLSIIALGFQLKTMERSVCATYLLNNNCGEMESR